MPNWCTNNLTVRGADAQTIVESITKDEGFFNTIIPMPEELRNTESPNKVSSDDMIEKYGSADWYQWALDNWGTKWDCSTPMVDHVAEDELIITFDTAWGPPIGVYEALERRGNFVEATYYEPGMGFVGKYTDGNDETFDVDDCPEYLDEIYGITETRLAYEREDD